MSFKSSIHFIFLITLLIVAHHAAAQTQTRKDTLKTVDLPTATVVGSGISKGNMTKINRADLDLVQSQTLGGTLSRVPGIQNSYHGPNSGVPMIRSLSGNRVKVLSNGLSVNDLSGISPNLNIMTDMDNLKGIEVYKGNGSILYGGKAIGGAINLKDNTIPVTRFEKGLEAKVLAEVGTNSGTRQAADINGNAGRHWAWHIGGMNQFHGDLKIPGNTKAPIAYDPKIDHMTQTLAQVHVDSEITRNLTLYPYLSQFVLNNMNTPEWDLSEADLYTFMESSVIGGQLVPNPRNDKFIPGQDPSTPFSTTIVKGIRDYAPVTRGIMPNSHAKSQAVNLGTSYISKNFYAGAGYRFLEGYYGVPGFALNSKPIHTHEAVTVSPDYLPINTRSKSNTLLFESEFRPDSVAISSLRLNYMLQLSEDMELVGDDWVNKFKTERQTVRMEIEQRKWRFFSGTTGFDFSVMHINGEGAMRYLPNNLSREYGAFTLQRVDLNPLHLNLGYRHDWVARSAMLDDTYKRSRGLSGGKLSAREFDLNDFNADLLLDIFKIGFLKASFVHAERAPDVNELYAGNDHFAIMVEENGDDRLNKETAKTVELGGGLIYKGLSLSASRYRTRFSNYMYLAHTGISRSGGFLVKEWRASDTEINGWEAELSYKSTRGKDMNWELGLFFDLVKNRNTSDDSMRKWAEGDYMPDLPTSRYGFSAGAGIKKISLNVSVDRYLKQRYLGKNINPEPPMPAYSLLAARIARKAIVKNIGVEYYVFGNNLLNVEARPQNSFLKYLAPLPGRNISVGIKATL